MAEDALIDRLARVRTVDVSDALDAMGLVDTRIMDPAMRPVWGPGLHAAGRARPARLVPSDRRVPRMSADEYFRRLGEMTDGCYRLMGEARAGDFLVIDAGRRAAGFCGSDMIMGLMEKGVRGVAIDGGCRDSHEVALEGGPVWCTVRTCAHVIGRLKFGSVDEPVACAGVTVAPGDFVLADDDGVVVVPEVLGEEVVALAEEVLARDKESRRAHYENLGLEPDDTVA
jgi:regulator of RNase E activity RraA